MILINKYCFIIIIALLFFFTKCKNEPITPDSNYLSVKNCDTVSVTYDNFVKQYSVTKSCVLCHTYDFGYIPYLDEHDSIKSYLQDSAKASLFMDKISTNHKILDSSHYNTECEISKFRSWIRMGAL